MLLAPDGGGSRGGYVPPKPTGHAPRPTSGSAPTPAAAPTMNASGYGIVPPVPSSAFPNPQPGATDYDRWRAAGQNPTPEVTPEPTQREQYETDYLKSLGWMTPATTSNIAPQKNNEMYSPNSLTPLAAYTYQVDAAERDRITDKYRNVEGFIPPSDTQGLPTPDAVPFEAEVETAELTWDAYNKLSNEARTAVDLNGLLVAARNLDLSKEYKLEGDELNEYNARATAIFGKPDTSTKVAPNVVHLLADINWSAVGQDLDEFLSLERGFTVSELKDLDTRSPEFEKLMETNITTPGSTSGYGNPNPTTTLKTNFGDVRSVENLESADAALAQAAGTRFNAVMADPALRLWDLPSSLALAQTGTTVRPTGKAVPYGYGLQTDRNSAQAQAQEAFYQSAYNYLADAGTTDLQPLWDEMSAMNFTPEDTNAFWRFVDDRTRQEKRWGQVGAPYGDVNRSYHDPDAIRKLVGLEG